MFLEQVYMLTDYDVRTGLQPQRFVMSFDSGNFGNTIAVPPITNARSVEVPDAKVFVLTHLTGFVRTVTVGASTLRIDIRAERAGVPQIGVHYSYDTVAAASTLFKTIDHDGPNVIIGPEEYLRLDIGLGENNVQYFITATGYLVPRGNVIT